MSIAPAELSRQTAAATVANMIAVASGKGGVGKTWLAATLAHSLALRGRRTLLVDGDLGLANVDVQLGLTPTKDLGGVLAGQFALADAALPLADSGLHVISGRSGSGSLATLPAEKLAEFGQELAALAASYDEVVLDLGAGIEGAVLYLARQAGRCLVVTSDEPTAITDAYAFIKVSLQQEPESDLRIAVNLVGTAAEGQRTYALMLRACQNFLKISPPLAGIVRRDPRVRYAIRHQTPLLTRHPNCMAAEDITKMARGLMEAA